MENQTYYIFKEITDADEFEQFLKLRYKVFMNSRMKDFVNLNEYEIDIQEEDMQAWHLGMYRVREGVVERVGYVRGVIEQYTEGAKWVRQIVAKHPKLMVLNGENKAKPLTFYTFPDSKGINEILQKCRDINRIFMKGSRLFIRDDLYNRPLLAIKLSEAIRTIFVVDKSASDAGMEVEDSHVRLYVRMGYKVIERTTSHGMNVSLMYAPTSEIEQNLREKATQMHEVLKETGCIHYYPHDEDNFYPPQYLKGNLV
jgi:hypothetical protein